MRQTELLIRTQEQKHNGSSYFRPAKFHQNPSTLKFSIIVSQLLNFLSLFFLDGFTPTTPFIQFLIDFFFILNICIKVRGCDAKRRLPEMTKLNIWINISKLNFNYSTRLHHFLLPVSRENKNNVIILLLLFFFLICFFYNCIQYIRQKWWEVRIAQIHMHLRQGREWSERRPFSDGSR